VQAGGDASGIAETRGNPALVKALARAFRWRRILEEGRHGSIRELAAAEGVDRSYVGRVLNLTLLAPDVVEAILDGRQPGGLTLPGQWMEGVDKEWAAQRRMLGGAARPAREAHP
jgi:hypothetical protein